MKAIVVSLFFDALIVGAFITSANTSSASNSEAQDVYEYSEELSSTPYSGMFFSTDYVVEEYEYDDAYCIIYDDPDANMFNVEICVDLDSYRQIREAINSGETAIGSLISTDEYLDGDARVYKLVPDPEFEMAAASATPSTGKQRVIKVECLTQK